MPTTLTHPYITYDENIGSGNPIIIGTRTRVFNIIAYHRLGLSPEELIREFPHLTLSKIYDALSYYYENKPEIDNAMEQDMEENIKTLVVQ